MVNSDWLLVIAAILLVGGLVGIVYAVVFAEFGRAKAEAEDRRNKDGLVDGAWHFGYISRFDKSETKTTIEFSDGVKMDVAGALPYDFRPGDFARFYYGCKTALSDFVAN